MINYTPSAKKAIDQAKRISKRLKHNYIGTEHLLLGLLHVEDSLASKVFLHEGINEENVIKLIEELIAPDGSVSVMERGGFTPKAMRVLSDAEEEARLSKLEEIGTEHIALAILKTPDCAATRLLASLEVSLQKIYQEIVASMGESGAAYQEELMKRNRMKMRPDRASVLEQYSRNISALAHEGKLDPIIGRKDEIQRVIEILSRRGKNNPCLIGEPGVGKTAIVEGLAEYIETGMVPDTVAGKRIMALDLS